MSEPPASTGASEPPTSTGVSEPPTRTGVSEPPTSTGASEPPSTEAGEFLRRLEAVARRDPGAMALLDDVGSLTYGELLAAVARRADELAGRGATRGSLVGLVLPRGRDLVVAMLAAWRLGAAFVPVDPAQPPARRRSLLEESRAWPVLGDDEAPRPPEPRRDLALAGGYVIYTSGSTGRPKGVRVGPAGLVPVLEAQIAAFGLGPGKRALWMLSPGFDASLSDLGAALLAGATLCPAPPGVLTPPALRALLAARAITHADLPPSLLALLGPTPTLEVIVIGGEVCPPAVVREVASRVRLISVYGPTEATICTSLIVCAPTWSEPRLGLPLPHVVYRVLDASRRPVRPGGEGELYIAGPALALGYLDRPALEAERFVEHHGERLYRTGDRVRRLDDGDLVFVGRVDRQVKLRGQLVAPEEIEAALREHPAVLEAAVRVDVLPRSARPDRERLVAHVVRQAAIAPDPGVDVFLSDLRAHLLERLPRALVPQLLPATALPRGPSGKVDLGALAAAPLPRASVAPGSPAAAPFVALFADILGLPAAVIGDDDDFFALGGDSHAALELLAEADARGLALPSDAVYRAPTPAALASARPATSRPVAELLVHPCLDRLAPDPSPASWRGERDDRVGPLPPVRSGPSVRGGHGGPPVRPSTFTPSFLLTGATGFLGSRLLAELLGRVTSPVHVVVRARDDREARERIRLAQAELGHAWGEGRIRVWRGDVSLPRFGLGDDAWRSLCAQTDVLVHGAARLHLLAPLAELQAANVTGCHEALRWRQQRGGDGTIHHVSTLSVLVATDHPDAVLDEASDPRDARQVHGGYAQSKWLAEESLRRAGGSVVHRPGLLTGDQRTGRPAPDCQLAQLLRGLAELGAVPAGDHDALRVDVTPVDHAARVLANVLTLYPDVPDIYHVASARGVTLARLCAALRAVGARCDEVSPAAFAQRWRQARRTDALATTWLSLDRLLGRPRPDADLFLLTGRELSCQRTEARTGLVHPALDDALLARYARAALATTVRA